jgi:hypothetical protein
MTYYNTSAMENATTIGEYLNEVSILTNGLIFEVIVFVIGIITFMSLTSRNYGTQDALIVTGFICTTISIMFWAAGFLGLWVIGPTLLLMLFGIAAKHFGGN